MTPGPLPSHCPNCSAAVYGPWCAQCGQETVISTPTVRELSHEYVQNFVSVEGRLWRTLVMLVTKPGGLTVEFLQGRRKRYARPLPLYLSMSFVLFLLFSLFPPTVIQMDLGDGDNQKSSMVSIQSTPKKDGANADKVQETYTQLLNEAPTLLKPMVNRYWQAYQHWQADKEKATNKASAVFLAELPYVVFLLVPVFAAASFLLQLRPRRSYAEHLLFALHLHAFVFLSLACTYSFPTENSIPLLFLTWMVYLTIAQRRVFGGHWAWHILRTFFLTFIYAALLTIAMTVGLFAAFGTV